MSNKNEEILRIYIEKLKYFNYSKNTIRDYSHYFGKFIESVDKYKGHHTSNDFEQYLFNYNFSSISQQNQIINALKFGYDKVFCRKYNKINFERPRKEHKLPNIIPEEYLKQCLEGITNLKHKTILSLTYSLGLRRADIQNLKLSDISSKSKQLKVVGGKGNKDAYLPLSDRMLDLIIKYYKEYTPKEYLFEGQRGNLYSGTSLNNLVKKYIGKQYHFHNLRHSFACHLLDKGVDIKYIQEFLRHEDIKTTMIYLKVSTKQLEKLPIY